MPTNDDQDATNEIVAATLAAQQQRAAAAATTQAAKATRWPLATISLGIGSAAVVAALLYANRYRKK
ncbi:MAG: hypothetical protein ABI240_07820 [Sphingomonas sp.]